MMAPTFELRINGLEAGQYSALAEIFPRINHAFSGRDDDSVITWSIVCAPRRTPETRNFAVHTMTRDVWETYAKDVDAFVGWMERFGWNDGIDDAEEE